MGVALRALIILFISFHLFARDLGKLYEKSTFKIGGRKFQAFIADDDEKRAQGLMFIESIPENEGMLFVFETERPLGFWMKNTLFPLSIGFFDEKGVLIDVQEMKVAGSLMVAEPPSYQSRGPAQFALEMNSGWFTNHKVKTGARLERAAKSKSRLLNQRLPLHESPRR